MTKSDAKQINQQIADLVEGAKSSHPFVGTWNGGAGVSLEIRLQSASDGRRIVVHKWDSEETCSVRYIFGSFWRPRPNREGVEYGAVYDVPFIADAIAKVANDLLAVTPA